MSNISRCRPSFRKRPPTRANHLAPSLASLKSAEQTWITVRQKTCDFAAGPTIHGQQLFGRLRRLSLL